MRTLPKSFLILSIMMMCPVLTIGQPVEPTYTKCKVFKVYVKGYANFRHDYQYETFETIGTDKMEVLGGADYEKPWEITYDLGSMTWSSKLDSSGVILSQQGMISNINETNAILNINVVSDSGISYHVLIDNSSDDDNVKVIYVRRTKVENEMTFVYGWTSNEVDLQCE